MSQMSIMNHQIHLTDLRDPLNAKLFRDFVGNLAVNLVAATNTNCQTLEKDPHNTQIRAAQLHLGNWNQFDAMLSSVLQEITTRRIKHFVKQPQIEGISSNYSKNGVTLLVTFETEPEPILEISFQGY